MPEPEYDTKKRDDAMQIWQAAVAAVDPYTLIKKSVAYIHRGETTELRIGHFVETIAPESRIIVVGMGKASAKMAKAMEEVLQPLVAEQRVSGWVNVPEDLVEPLTAIHLHGARPAQLNEATEKGVFGSQKIVDLIRQATPQDVIICLISGGGSALLPLPEPEISLEETLAITQLLSAGGANIEELNTVRKEMSQLKGGGIRKMCSGKRLYSLVLSDVLGDPPDVIASGTTVRNSTTAKDALEVLKRYHAERESNLQNLCAYIRRKAEAPRIQPDLCDDSNHHYYVIGSIQTAAEAAGAKARELGYNPLVHWSDASEGTAEEVGSLILQEGLSLFAVRPSNRATFLYDREGQFGPYDCVISGGEPVVRLVAKEKRGVGGRNQQLVLAALLLMLNKIEDPAQSPVFLSGGTDGEDGPTNAAGAFFDPEVFARVKRLMAEEELNPEIYRRTDDAWTFFDKVGGLVVTGGTGTNVCDLRVMISPY